MVCGDGQWSPMAIQAIRQGRGERALTPGAVTWNISHVQPLPFSSLLPAKVVKRGT